MTRIEREKRIVEEMILLYCRHKEGNRNLCPDCRELAEYAKARLDGCRFGEKKQSCRRCHIHCYRADMRERIRAVMRYSGPRLVLYHPAAAMSHLLGI